MTRCFNPIRTIVIRFIVLAFASQLAGGEELDANEYRKIKWSYFQGEKYAFGLKREVVEEMPTWNIGQKMAPKVSPQGAYKVAKSWLDTLPLEDGFRWDLDLLALEPVDIEKGKWVWYVSFEYEVLEGGSSGPAPTMGIYVTLDGKLVQPVISKWKK